MRRFASRRTGDGGTGTRWDYDGPCGPMTAVIGRSGEPTTVHGPQVGNCQMVWDAFDADRLDQLRRGIEVTIGDERIRLWRASGGLTRRARAIIVERQGRPARLRLRRWEAVSLEAASVLVRGRLYRGRVADDAQPVDVALFLLMTASGLHLEVRL